MALGRRNSLLHSRPVVAEGIGTEGIGRDSSARTVSHRNREDFCLRGSALLPKFRVLWFLERPFPGPCRLRGSAPGEICEATVPPCPAVLDGPMSVLKQVTVNVKSFSDNFRRNKSRKQLSFKSQGSLINNLHSPFKICTVSKATGVFFWNTKSP